MPQLPAVGATGWGATLNGFLETSHDNTTTDGGKLKADLASIIKGGKAGFGKASPDYSIDISDKGYFTLTGSVTWNPNDNFITGTGTKFLTELKNGDSLSFYDSTGKIYWGANISSVGNDLKAFVETPKVGGVFSTGTIAKKVIALGTRIEDTSNDSAVIVTGSAISFPKLSTKITNNIGYNRVNGSLSMDGEVTLALRGPSSRDKTIYSPAIQLYSSEGGVNGGGKGSVVVTLENSGSLVDSSGNPPYFAVSEYNFNANTGIGIFSCHKNSAWFGVPLYVTGAVYSNSVQLTSDRNLKKDIKPITSSLEKVTKVNGVTYNWKDESMGKKLQMGVIAQEVEEVFPTAVETDEKGKKTVNYNSLIAPLIESVKELKSIMEAQAKEIADLKEKLAK